MSDRATSLSISRSLAPLREVVESLSQAADGSPPTGNDRRRLARKVRAAGVAAIPALLRGLLSPVDTEARWAAWLLMRLARPDDPRVVERVTRLVEDPRLPEETRARCAMLLADLSAAPSRVERPSPRLAEFLRTLQGEREVALAIELMERDVDEEDVIAVVAELARGGGTLAIPLLDGLLHSRRHGPTTMAVIANLRDQLAIEIGAETLADPAGANGEQPAHAEARSVDKPRRIQRGKLDEPLDPTDFQDTPSACDRRTSPEHDRTPRALKRAASRKRGLDLVGEGRYRAARPLLERAVDDDPADAEALSHLGVCLLNLGHAEDSLARLEQAAVEEPEVPLHHWNIAAAARAAGRMCRSYLALQRYLAASDAEPGARERRREARRYLRGYEDVFRDSHPGVAIADLVAGEQAFELAFAAMERKRYAEAIEGFERVLGLIPNHHPSWGNLGVAFLALGQRDEAERCLLRALDIKPDYAVAIDNLRTIRVTPSRSPSPEQTSDETPPTAR